eukprot:1152931-Pelagomonas_calceolata.AAC.3
MHTKLAENASQENNSKGSLGCPPGSRRKQKRPGQYANSVCLNLKQDRVNLGPLVRPLLAC